MMFVELVAFHRSKRRNFVVIYQDNWNNIGEICHKYFLLRNELHGIYLFVCFSVKGKLKYVSVSLWWIWPLLLLEIFSIL